MHFQAQSLSQLRADNRIFARTALLAVADRIAEFQFETAADFTRARTEIDDNNVEEHAKKIDFSTRSLSAFTRYMKPEDVAATKHKQAVDEFKSGRIETYRNAALDELFSLNKIK